MVRIPGLKKPKKTKELSDDLLEKAHRKLVKTNKEKHVFYFPLSIILLVIVAILYLQYTGTFDLGVAFRINPEPELIPEPIPEPIVEEPIVEALVRFEIIDETNVRALDKTCKELAPQSSKTSRDSTLYSACTEYCSIAFLGPFNGQFYCTSTDLLTCSCGQ